VALGGLMSMLGPLWAGAAYDHVMPNSPYWMGAVILGIACLLLMQVKGNKSQVQTKLSNGATGD